MKFFRNLKEKLTSYEIFTILISSIVGALFSFIPFGDEKTRLIVISVYGAVVLAFLITVVFLEISRSKFDYYRMIEKEYKRNNWINVFTLGYPLSRPLWNMSKLSLRVKVGQKVKEAVVNLIKDDIKEINSTEFNGHKIYAGLLIDDLGYTNYVLGNIPEAIRMIKDGINYAKKHNLLSLELRGHRHLLAMLSSGKIHFSNKEAIFGGFCECYSKVEAQAQETPKMKEAYLSAKYAFLKYEFTFDLLSNKEIVTQLENLQTDFDAISKTEWAHKCTQLIYEIGLSVGNCETHIDNLRDMIKNPTTAVIHDNRLLKLVNLFLDFMICRVSKDDNFYNYNRKDSIDQLMDLQRSTEEIIYRGVEISNESEDYESIESFKVKKALFFKTINSRIKTAKKNLVLDRYKLLLVDFDYTIFNYHATQERAVKSTFKELGLRYLKKHAKSYKEINERIWQAEKLGLQFQDIKKKRIEEFCAQWNIVCDQTEFAKHMDRYMEVPVWMEHARKFINKRNTQIFLYTNASKSRRTKLKFLTEHFDDVYSSEDARAFKPNREFFDNLLNTYYPDIDRSSILVIGDGEETDIEGAVNAEIDSCLITIGAFYRKGIKRKTSKATYKVKNLRQLLKLKNRKYK